LRDYEGIGIDIGGKLFAGRFHLHDLLVEIAPRGLQF